jgi:hypothetical protein
MDPSEQNNLADKYPEIVGEMLIIMEEAHTEISEISLFKPEIKADMDF